MRANNLTLLTDLYELTMMQGLSLIHICRAAGKETVILALGQETPEEWAANMDEYVKNQK